MSYKIKNSNGKIKAVTSLLVKVGFLDANIKKNLNCNPEFKMFLYF